MVNKEAQPLQPTGEPQSQGRKRFRSRRTIDLTIEKEIRSNLTIILADLTYLGFVRLDDHSILYSRPPGAQNGTPDQPHAFLSKKP
ncbi:hypothetical protein PSHT_12088 [Puccinia striiformis]|uniref:Uncharacterized protein n=1 Tax=Puccinia striiformis TaxID=27350 RepID=A0A2S4UYY9_9BASI|nr:hypothetical protein PSHT_12088 [Puccinia striiformis]